MLFFVFRERKRERKKERKKRDKKGNKKLPGGGEKNKREREISIGWFEKNKIIFIELASKQRNKQRKREKAEERVEKRESLE